MIATKIQGEIPKKFYVALSGGVDSVAIYNFLKKSRHREVTGVFIHHGTETSEKALNFLKNKYSDLKVEYIDNSNKHEKESLESFWSKQRNAIFQSVEYPVITAHHLDDQLETYLLYMLRGKPRIQSYRNCNVFRPFRLCRKKDFIQFNVRNNIEWIEDKSNNSLDYTRNRIRNCVIPEIEKCNGNMLKFIEKLVKEDFEKYGKGSFQK